MYTLFGLHRKSFTPALGDFGPLADGIEGIRCDDFFQGPVTVEFDVGPALARRRIRISGSVTATDDEGHPVEISGGAVEVSNRSDAEDFWRLGSGTADGLRRAIARSLHDELGAEASSALFRARRLQELSAGAEIDLLIRELEAVVNGIRTAAYNLHPVNLDDLGLGDALLQLTKQFSEWSGLQIETHIDKSVPGRLTGNLDVLLYRVTREALTNVVKHARANSASVLLTVLRNRIRLLIEDDGIGLGDSAKGIGLSSLEERVLHAGGTVDFGTSFAGGTSVAVTFEA
ncbi:MAG: ATP-binding protein [Myxococcota bacterium]